MFYVYLAIALLTVAIGTLVYIVRNKSLAYEVGDKWGWRSLLVKHLILTVVLVLNLAIQIRLVK